jgi:DNA helicase-2/ATP-dependent DNA helicase PcrA
LYKEKKISLGELLVEEYENGNQSLPQYSSVVNIFGDIYTKGKSLDVLSLIEYVLDRTKYIEWFDDGSEEAMYKKENIDELKSIAGSYAVKYGKKSLGMFLQEINLIEEEQKRNQDGSGNYLNLMTIHSSKGLEFDNVFLIGMEEGILPHSISFTDDTQLEEERRLCYVGITRARERLYLTFANRRLTKEGFVTQIPSRFLGEIPQDICEYYSSTTV